MPAGGGGGGTGGFGTKGHGKKQEKLSWQFSLVLHFTMFYVMCCFAGYTCIGRHLEDESPLFEPIVFLLIRHWSSAVVIGGIFVLKEGFILPKAEDLGRILLCGCVGVSATQLLFIYGLRATTATNAACIEPLIPCIVFILATMFKMEPATWSRTFLLRVFGVIVGCAGAMVTTLGHARAQVRLQGVGSVPRVGNRLPKIAGDAAILLQCFTLAMYLLLTRTLSNKYSAMQLTAYCMLAGAIFTSFVTLLSLVASGGEWPGWSKWHFDEAFYFEEIYASLIASVQNYALRMWAIQYLPATTISMYFCVDPPATALFAAIFLHEQIHLTQVIGSIFILLGMWITIKFGQEGEILEKALDNGDTGSINSTNNKYSFDSYSHKDLPGDTDDEENGIEETSRLLSKSL